MRPGTPGFVGRRLKEAREARGITQIALAETLGVSPQTVSQYEAGKSSPHPDVMTKIPGVLNMPFAFFLQPRLDDPEGTVFARSLSSATATARTRSEWRFRWFKDVMDYLAGLVDFPPVRFPGWEAPADPSEIRAEDIESAAAHLRAYWSLGDGPIGNVVEVVEQHGGRVTRMTMGAATLDAFSEWRPADNRPYFALGIDKAAAVRSRWNLCHEIGHMMLHKHLGPSWLRKKEKFHEIEDQAHRFAGAFLLPAASFADDFFVPSLDRLMVLKMKWRVSMAAILMRAVDLGLVDPELAPRFWRAYARKGYKKGEPLDDQIPVELPELPRRALEMLFSSGVRSAATFNNTLNLSPSDVEELAGLSPGYLRNRPQVLSLRSRPEVETAPHTPQTDTTVLEFRRRN